MAQIDTKEPDEFAQQVQDALEHLSDPLVLRGHPLARWIVRENGTVPSPSEAGRLLRQRLLDALAAVQPPTGLPRHLAAERRFRLLRLRYVEVLRPATVQAQLGISRSQFYREQQRALASVVSLLAEQWLPVPASGLPANPQPDSPAGEAMSGAPSLGRQDRPARETIGATAQHPVAHLPPRLTSFVGRQGVLGKLVALLAGAPPEHAGAAPAAGDGQPRLVTLLGPPGAGKTRLAVEAAALLARDYAWEVHFVDLSLTHDPQCLLPAIARALDVAVAEGGETALAQRVAGTLCQRPQLLILDNFEQLLAASPQVADLLGACPDLRILVTSRAALRIGGEQEFPVPPLPFPGLDRLPPVDQLARFDAIRLFVDRAQSIRPEFALTAQNAAAVATVCSRVDGLPLAIELAASRTRVLPVEALPSRMDRRVPLLVGDARDLPARQQTMRAALDWSYTLLSDDERALLRRLAVFAGGCTLEAVEAVCYTNSTGDLTLAPLDGLAALVSKSLLCRDERASSEPRFLLLDIIHEYALEHLEASGERAALRRRHATYYLGLAECLAPRPGSADQGAGRAWLKAEHDNLRAALDWVREHGDVDRERPARAAAGRCKHLWGRFPETRVWLERGSAPTGASSPGAYTVLARTKALKGIGHGAAGLVDGVAAYVVDVCASNVARDVGHASQLAASLGGCGRTPSPGTSNQKRAPPPGR